MNFLIYSWIFSLIVVFSQIERTNQISVFQKLGLKLGKVDFLPEEDEPVDEKVIKLKLPELLKMMGYDPDKLLEATKIGDVMTLRQFRTFIRNKIAPIVSPACMGDMIYFADSLLEVALAQYDLSNTCVKDDKLTEEKSANCSCAKRVDESIGQNTWTLDVLDSLGKIPAGFLSGNFWFLGDYDECVQISVPKSSMKHRWEGQYCRVDIFLFESKWVENISSILDKEFHDELFSRADAGEAFVFMPSSRFGGAECSNLYNFKLGTCFPKTCTLTDVQAVVGFALNFPQRLAGQRAICSTNVLCHKELEIKKDGFAAFLIFLLAFTAFLVIFGTLYDYYVYQDLLKNLTTVIRVVKLDENDHLQNNSYERIHETKDEFYTRQSWFVKVLLAFSVYTNGPKVFDTTQKPGQIHCLHGIRVFSMFWIILGHTYYWSMNYLDNPLAAFDLPKDFLNQIILNASLSVDAFYLLSATLIVYLWMKEMKKTKGKRVLSGKLWSMFYIHRYVRLTPVYMVIMAIDIVLIRYLTDGPLWNQKGIEPHGCVNSWWTNLLYVNNFFWLKEQCMTWTWYLANDVQFYVLTPPILIILWMKEILGLVVIGVLILLTSMIRMGLILQRAKWPPISILMNDPSMISIMEDYWNDIYIKPYCRCGPFLVGLILGYIFYKTEMKAKMPKWAGHVGWILAAAMGVGIVFGLYDYSKTAYISLVGKIIYAAFGRVLWAISLSWVIFACSTGYGGPVNAFLSWRFWMPMGRLVYCAYLIHPILIIVFYTSQMRPIHFSGHFLFIMYYFCHIFFAFLMALVLSLMFEVPIMGLEKLLFGAGHGHIKQIPMKTMNKKELNEYVENVKVEKFQEEVQQESLMRDKIET